MLSLRISGEFPLRLSLISKEPLRRNPAACRPCKLTQACFWLTPVPRASQVALVEKNPPANAGDARDTGLIPGSGRSPGERKWQPTPVFLPGKFHGQRSLLDYHPWGHKRVRHDWVTKHTCTCQKINKYGRMEKNKTTWCQRINIQACKTKIGVHK